MSNSLNIVEVAEKKSPAQAKSSPRIEAQARFEKLWKESPEQFSAERDCMERERLARTLAFIGSPPSLVVVDLGCGSGAISRALTAAGARVTAVDIASQPLAALKIGPHAPAAALQDYVPRTLLDDGIFDLVIATELIAYLPSSDYRLFFAELARLSKGDGRIVCSTPIDIFSENALDRFASLAETELEISHWSFSYHYLFIRLRDLFNAPRRFAKGWRDKRYRSEELNNRSGISRGWFRLNSSWLLAPFWFLLQGIASPCSSLLNRSRGLLLLLEKVSRLLWQEEAISHALFIGKRRSMLPPLEKELQPQELKHKKQVWE